MNRRHFVASTLSVAGLAAVSPGSLLAASRGVDGPGALRRGAGGGLAIPPRCVIVIDLAGGNDGLNTIVPLTDPLYRRLRPTLALDAAQTVPLDGARRLHAALAPLLPLWRAGEFAVVEGVGTRGRPLAHFRATQVWRSGSRSDVHRSDDWLDRALAVRASAGRALTTASPPGAGRRDPGVPGDVGRSEPGARAATPSVVSLTAGRFGDAAHRAADAVIADDGIGAVRLTLPGFDTHHRQKARHAAALTELAGGITILRQRLQQAGRWNDALIMTTSEFGRAAAENAQGGTDHGAAAPQLLLGGRVNGGFHGTSPRLDVHGAALEPGVDHRRVLATVLASWWGIAPARVLEDAPAALPGLLRV